MADYHYIIVMTDLSTGTIAAQIVHAAGESVSGSVLERDTRSVVLGVPNEEALDDVCFRFLIDGGSRGDLYRIVETEGEHAGQLMALGIAPGPRSEVPSFLRGLKLYG